LAGPPRWAAAPLPASSGLASSCGWPAAASSSLITPAAVAVARAGLRTVAAAVLLLGAFVAILGALAMRRIVVERLLAALALAATVPLAFDLGGFVAAVRIVGEVAALVPADCDAAAAPLAAAPRRGAARHPDAERDRRSAPGVGRRIRVVVGGIGRRRGSIHDGRVVARYVDPLRTRRLDLDDGL